MAETTDIGTDGAAWIMAFFFLNNFKNTNPGRDGDKVCCEMSKINVRDSD